MLLAISSSVGTSGEDMMLDERFGNRDRGGASPRSSRRPGFRSGDPVVDSF